MYKSTDNLVDSERGQSTAGYQTIDGNTGDATPHTTFYARIRQAKEDSTGCCDFCVTFLGLLLGSIVWTVVLLIILTLPMVMIVIGVQYLYDCPAQRKIPIFLIVSGCFVVVSDILHLADRLRKIYYAQSPESPVCIRMAAIIVNIFLLAWFFCGCVWTYAIYRPQFADIACNTFLYSFTFWLLNAIFMFFGSLVIAIGCGLCLAFLCT